MAKGEVISVLLVKTVAVLVLCNDVSLGHETILQGDRQFVAVSVVEDGHPKQPLTRQYANKRVRREATTNRDKLGFNAEEKRILVAKHNALRRMEGASDMKYMVWDEDLEALAQAWAENCDFQHRPDRKDVGSFSYAGENLYAGTGSYDPEYVVELWYNETEYYNFNTQACSNVCGHYTQVVWASSFAMGCGVAYCPQLTNVSFKRGWHVACNYGPGGNYVGQRPYKKGEACSQCDKEAIFCVDGLCSKFPVIDIGSSASLRNVPAIRLLTCLLIFSLCFCSI